MTWTGKLWSFGTTPDDVDMNALQADITAKANGDSGAPQNKLASMAANSVDTSQLVAASVNQSKLATATSTHSTTATSAVPAQVRSLTGGEYCFYPEHYTQTAGDDSQQRMAAVGSTFDAELMETFYFGFNNTSYVASVGIEHVTDDNTIYWQDRYVQASPPYDLGDGLCHLFTFVQFDDAGNIFGVSSAPDAPWHYNGPTDIRESKWKTLLETDDYDVRDLYDRAQFAKRMLSVYGELTDQQLQDVSDWIDILPTLTKISVNEPVPQSVKNADMTVIPHPFGTLPRGHSVALLDPLSDLSAMLAAQQEAGEIEVTRLLHEGFFKINNAALSRIGPPGVKTVSYRWR